MRPKRLINPRDHVCIKCMQEDRRLAYIQTSMADNLKFLNKKLVKTDLDMRNNTLIHQLSLLRRKQGLRVIALWKFAKCVGMVIITTKNVIDLFITIGTSYWFRVESKKNEKNNP